MSKYIFDFNNLDRNHIDSEFEIIITTGEQEYNVTITELFAYHELNNNHDMTEYLTEASALVLINQNVDAIAGPKMDAKITLHETDYDHDDFLTNATVTPIINTAIGAIDFGNLHDVNLTSLQNNHIVRYSEGQWINSTFSGLNASLEDLVDTNLNDISEEQVIMFSSGIWKNKSMNMSTLGDTQTGGASDGDILTYDGTNERWINGSIDTSGFTGSFITAEDETVTVENGLIKTVVPNMIWWDYSEQSELDPLYGSEWYDNSTSTTSYPDSGWTFISAV